MKFDEALDFCRKRGGTLVDESNPALQGFISWELWRRHRYIHVHVTNMEKKINDNTCKKKFKKIKKIITNNGNNVKKF